MAASRSSTLRPRWAQRACGYTRGLLRAPALLLGLWCALGLLGCAHTPVPCQRPSDCDRSDECLANRCLPLGSLPVSRETERVVVEPQRLRWVGDAARHIDLAFAPPSTSASVAAAFLLLPLRSSANGVERSVRIEARLLIDPWTSPEPHASGTDAHAAAEFAPRTSRARALGLGRSGSLARVDVTALMGRWLDEPRAAHGVRLSMTDEAGEPVLVGLNTGVRLELYCSAAPQARSVR